MSEFEICYSKVEWFFPNAVIGDPSATFNFVMLACIGVLKLLSIVWHVEYLMRDMAAPKSVRAL